MNNEISQLISRLLCQLLPEVKLAYVFGSQVNGNAQADSDWDIAILTEQAISTEACWDLAQQLANTLNCDVDLIDLRTSSTILNMQIVDNGVRILGDQTTADIFETQTLSMYAHLQESRQHIVNEFVDTLKNG